MSDVTTLLARWRAGDQDAFEQLFEVLYGELRRLAQHRLNGERSDHTLQGTALVHEAYLRLVGQRRVQWQGRGHFLAVAAQAMRRILVDHSRRRSAAKRGANAVVPLDGELLLGPTTPDFSALDEALQRLAARDARRAAVVELRFFGGMTEQEIGDYLQTSPATVRRDWTVARAWLFKEMQHASAPPAPTAAPRES